MKSATNSAGICHVPSAHTAIPEKERVGRRPTETEGNSWDGCRLSEGLNTRLIGKSSEDHSPMPSSCAMYPHRTASPNQPCPPERVSPGFCGVKHVQVPPEQAHRYLTQVSLSYCPTPCLIHASPRPHPPAPEHRRSESPLPPHQHQEEPLEQALEPIVWGHTCETWGRETPTCQLLGVTCHPVLENQK